MIIETKTVLTRQIDKFSGFIFFFNCLDKCVCAFDYLDLICWLSAILSITYSLN